MTVIRFPVPQARLANAFRRARLAAQSRSRSMFRRLSKGIIQIPIRQRQEEFIQRALRQRSLAQLNEWRNVLRRLDEASADISLTYTDNINQIVEDNPSWIQRGSDFIEGGINLIANILQDIQNVRNFLDDNMDVLDDLGLGFIQSGIDAFDSVANSAIGAANNFAQDLLNEQLEDISTDRLPIIDPENNPIPKQPPAPPGVNPQKGGFSGSSGQSAIDNLYSQDQLTGVAFPFIRIGDIIFTKSVIEKFSIYSDGFLPYCHLQVKTNRSSFLQMAFPKKGDLIEFYFALEDNEPGYVLGGKYSITSIKVEDFPILDGLDDDSNPVEMVIDVMGQLYVKDLFKIVNKTVEGNSLDVLKQICKDLKIGLITNVQNTTDRMKWHSGQKTYADWIVHVANHAFIGDSKFFDFYIDVNYHLNFIEVDSILSDKKKNSTYNTVKIYKDPTKLNIPMFDEIKTSYTEMPLFISNNPSLKSSGAYFNEYSIEYNGEMDFQVLSDKRNLLWIASNLEKKETIGNNGVQAIKREPYYVPHEFGDFNYTEANKMYKETVRRNFLGILYEYPDHNVHQDYHRAEIANLTRRKEMWVKPIRLNMQMVNFTIKRSMNLFTLFYTLPKEYASAAFSKNPIEAFNEGKLYLDNYNTDVYYTLGINYHFVPNDPFLPLSQEIFLYRKHIEHDMKKLSAP